MYSVCSERCKIRAEYSTTSILTVSCFANHPNHRNLGQFEAELIFALCTGLRSVHGACGQSRISREQSKSTNHTGQ